MRLHSRTIEKKAKEIAITQGKLGTSPFTTDQSNKTILCAAACIAYASHELAFGKSAAETVINRLKTAPANHYSLEQAFEEIGLPTNLCKKIRAENDEKPESDRLEWFLGKTFFGTEGQP